MPNVSVTLTPFEVSRLCGIAADRAESATNDDSREWWGRLADKLAKAAAKAGAVTL